MCNCVKLKQWFCIMVVCAICFSSVFCSESYNSIHPYENDVAYNHQIDFSGAIGLSIRFSYAQTEADNDFVVLCKTFACEETWGNYSGEAFPGISAADLIVPADRFYLQFQPNSIVNGWGYEVVVTPIYSSPGGDISLYMDNEAPDYGAVSYESSHPYRKHENYDHQVNFPGAVALTVHFYNQTRTKSEIAPVTLCEDSSCNTMWGMYSGTAFPGLFSNDLLISSENLFIQFMPEEVTDEYWGYAVLITPIYAITTINGVTLFKDESFNTEETFSTDHPYFAISYNFSVSITGALGLNVHFNPSTYTEVSPEEHVVSLCKDSTCEQFWGVYSGDNFPGVTTGDLIIPADSFFIYFEPDRDSIGAFGFEVTVTPLYSLPRPVTVTINVDDSVADAVDPNGEECASRISANSSAACSLRSAWEYCSNFDGWAAAAATVYDNHCSIVVAENSHIYLNRSLGELYIHDNDGYSFTLTVVGSGSGASIYADTQIFYIYVDDGMSGHDSDSYDSIVTFSNLNLISSHPGVTYTDDNGGVLMPEENDYAPNDGSNIPPNDLYHEDYADYGGGMYIANVKNLYLDRITMSNFHSNYYGGAIYIYAVNYITGDHLLFNNNSALERGGSLYAYSAGIVVLSNSVVVESSSKSGGGMYFSTLGNFMYVANSSFRSNFADESAGGLFFSSGTEVVLNAEITIVNTTFEGNIANGTEDGQGGGGLYVERSLTCTMENLAFNSNSGSSGGGLYLGEDATLYITSCLFTLNSAADGGALFLESGVYFDGTDVSLVSNVADAGGGIYCDEDSQLLLKHSEVRNNSATGTLVDDGGGGMYLKENDVWMENVIIEGNAAEYGGAVVLRSNTNVELSNCSLVNNTASTDGGALYLYESIAFVGVNLTIENNAANSGGGIYVGNSGENFLLTHSSVTNNSALFFGAGIMFADQCNSLTFTSVSFSQNVASFQGGAFYFMKFSDFVHIETCLFLENSAKYGGALFINQFLSNVDVLNCIFEENVALSGGAVYIESQNSYVSFLSNEFTNNVAEDSDGGAVYVGASNNNIDFYNSAFFGNIASSIGGAIHSVSSNADMNISGCVFAVNTAHEGGGAVSFVSRNEISVYNNTFLNNSAYGNNGEGGALYVGSSNIEFFIDANIFIGNSAHIGGAAYVGDSSTGIMGSNIFTDNYGNIGGAVTLSGTLPVNFTHCTFRNNSAIESLNGQTLRQITATSTIINDLYSGGALALLTYSRNISFEDCLFSGNLAFSGSALYSHTAQFIHFKNCTLRQNFAVTYGTIFWGFEASTSGLEPVLVNVTYHDNNTYARGTLFATALSTLFATQGLVLSASGSEFIGSKSKEIFVIDYSVKPHIQVEILDYYGNVKLYDIGSSVTAAVNGSMLGCLEQGSGSISGETSVTSSNGVAAFDHMSFSCYPSGRLSVIFSSSDVTSDSLMLFFSICDDGFYLSDSKCVMCAKGFYSLDYSDSATCSAAPDGTDANYTYANQIYVNPGYWRINSLTTSIMECPYGSDACIGEYEVGTNSCSVGYEGPLCGVCSDEYYPNTIGSTTTCVACDTSGSLILLLLPAIILFVCAGGFIFFSIFYFKLDTRRIQAIMALGEDDLNELVEDNDLGNTSPMDSLLGKLKILVSSYQIVSGFPAIFTVSFPPAAAAVFNFFSFINLIAFNMPSASCYSSSNVDYVFMLMMTTLMPICITFLLFLLFVSEKLYGYIWLHAQSQEEKAKSAVELVNRYFTLFLLLTYLVLPSVSSTIALAYSCSDVDPNDADNGQDYFLTADLSISCSSPRYHFGVAWATVMLCLYPIGVPALYFYLLRKHKEDITQRLNPQHKVNDDAYKSLEFLFKSYEPQYWYWEVVETGRRLFFTFLLQFGQASINTQIVVSMVVAVMFMKAYAFFEPYEEDAADILQEMAQYQVFFTLFGALLLRTEALGSSSDITLALSIFLVIVNIAATITCLIFFTAPFVDDFNRWIDGNHADLEKVHPFDKKPDGGEQEFGGVCPDREAKLIKDKESDVEMFQKEEQKMNEDDPEYDAAGTDGKWTRLSRVAVAPEATEDGGGGTMEILSTMELQTLLQKYQMECEKVQELLGRRKQLLDA